MKTRIFRLTAASTIAVAGLALCHCAHASTFRVDGSGNSFTVSRSGDGTNFAETVSYRTVGLSAYGGQHFVAKYGTLTFAPNQTSTNVVVTETMPTTAAYKFQTGASRYYRFEITDAGGFLVTNATRTLTTGTRVTASDAFGVKNLTIQSSEYTADDRGYDSNGYKSVSSNGYFAAAAPKAYFQLVDAQLRMTLSMDAKENDDAYEYLQLLFNNTSTCDNRSGASNGDPGTPSLSSYMAGFEMDTGSKDDTYRTYTFPVTNVANNAGATNPWGYSSNGKYPLSKQKFNTTTSSRAADGRIVVPLNFTNIVLRLNASGSSGSDQWAAKSVVAHVQAVDTNAPYKIAAAAAPGIHARGNAIYVSVAFSEPVTGTPSLTTSWGTLNYFSGSGSNVLTFKGTIPADATGALNITGWSGNIKDLAGNPLGATALTQKNLATLDTSHTYAIAYDLAGGALPEGASNPATYTYETPSFTLATPTRPGYIFAGWTGSNGTIPQTSVTVAAQSHGDLAYTANWKPITYSVRFDPGAADATGPMPDQSFTYDAPQALSSNAFTRAGYTFAGWRGADGAIYPDRATVLNLTNAQDAVVSLTATWRPNIPYIDEDGTEQICTDYTVLTDATSGVTYGEFGATAWYVVTNAVTISGQLGFRGTSHLILCDGATLAVTNANGYAIDANDLTIYGQTNGSGTVTANGNYGIYAPNSGSSVTINGGTVTATGGNGICANGSVTINGGTVTAIATATGGRGIYTFSNFNNSSVTINGGTVTAIATATGSRGISAGYSVTINSGTVTAIGKQYGIYAPTGIILGWTNPADSITASSYYNGGHGVCVKSGQRLTDGSAIYKNDVFFLSDLAGKTLRPVYSITLPEGVVAGGVVTQDVTTAYAWPGTNVTLNATPGYAIGDVTVNGDAIEPVDGIYSFAASADGITVTATVGILYIDEGGVERFCTDFTVLTNAAGNVGYGGGSGWYVVTSNVTISGQLYFRDNSAHLILCDGATLAVTNANGRAIQAGDLTIYGQTNGTGSVTATGGNEGIIWANNDVTINGGTVTANGTNGNGIFAAVGSVTINGGTVTANGGTDGNGIRAQNGSVTLGWTNPTDSITASSYQAGSIRVKSGQRLTDGSDIYEGYIFDSSALAGKTLRPAYSISLPEGVVANGVVTQDGTTAYALPGTNVTLNAAPGYYGIGNVTVDGVPLAPVAGVYSFAASDAAVTIAATVTPVTYSVRFDGNGGEGSMPDQSFTYGAPQALSSNAFTRAGYTFAGWRGADGAIYADGATVLNLTNAQDAVVSLVAQWGIPYIDEDGTEQICTDYTVLTNTTGGVTYGGGSGWYVVTNAVTISGNLYFGDISAHLILCDGATLAVTNENGDAIEANGNLTIYGQTNGTGTVTATGGERGISPRGFFLSVTINGGTVTANGGTDGIFANGSVTINGGTVTATGSRYGIWASGSVILGWTKPTDSITASSYRGVVVKTGQPLTDGSNIYKDTDDLGSRPSALAGKTLRPAYRITLPEGVVANGVVRQDGTTAYARPGDTVTLSAAAPGYVLGKVTVNGVSVAPVDGIYSFAASADGITVVADVVTPSEPDPGNVWHVPSSKETCGRPMRDPLEPGDGAAPFLRLGNQSDVQDGWMTAANIKYRIGTSGAWSSIPMSLEEVAGGEGSQNAYWTNALPAAIEGQTVQYYFEAQFGNSASLWTTYVFDDGADGCDKGVEEVEAQASPFEFTVSASQSFTDPQGVKIEDAGLVGWLVANNFTQSDINALGEDAAATDKLYECWVLNCDLTAANPGGALSITGFAVSDGQISITVQLVRQSPLGFINGALYLYCADDLATGFGRSPIANEIIDFGDGDSTFDVDSATVQTSGSVTQTVTATFDTYLVSAKFIRAAIDKAEEPEEEE